MTRWNVTRVLAFAYVCMQGGGLAIYRNGGSATLNSCQVYLNEATVVVLAFRTFRTFLPSPRWNVTCSVFGLQGGGLYIVGTATLTNTNVYSNRASSVRSLSALA